MRSLQRVGTGGFVVCILAAFVLPQLRSWLLVGGFALLIAGYVVELLISRKPRRIAEGVTVGTLNAGDIVLSSGSLCVFDNWNGDRIYSLACPPGSYGVNLVLAEGSGRALIKSIRIQNSSEGAAASNVSVPVDSGFLVFVDAVHLQSRWDCDQMEEQILQMLELPEIEPPFFHIKQAKEIAGIVLIPGEGDGTYNVVVKLDSPSGVIIESFFD